jgi:DnaJ-class molecular chaperone
MSTKRCPECDHGKIKETVKCSYCDGKGETRAVVRSKCLSCHGRGQFVKKGKTGKSIITLCATCLGKKFAEDFEEPQPCRPCKGVGTKPGKNSIQCARCKGTGKIEVNTSAMGALGDLWPQTA